MKTVPPDNALHGLEGLISRIASIIIWTSSLAVVLTVGALAVPGVRDSFDANTPPSYTIGDVIDVDREAYRHSWRTVLIFSRASCSACRASQPVMAKLVGDLSGRAGVRVSMVTGFTEHQEDRRFAESVGVDAAAIFQTDFRTLRLRYVPAVVVIDSAGRILMAKQGLLTETDRQDIVDMIIRSVHN